MPELQPGLILPESSLRSSVTCPRCLAEVIAREARREADAIQTERPERHEDRSHRRVYRPDDVPDLDVRRDTKRTSCLVIVLAVIGGLGVGRLGLTALVGGVARHIRSQLGSKSALFVWVCLLLFLASLITLIVFVRLRGNPGVAGFRRVAIGTLALAGAAILVIFLLYLSIFIFAFIVCYGTKIG